MEFVDRALDLVFARYAVDPSRVVAEGFSDGASYALSLGLLNGDLFTHVIAFSPGFVTEGSRRGKPRLFVSHGVHDPVLPIDLCSRRIVRDLRGDDYDVRTPSSTAGTRFPPRSPARRWTGWPAPGEGALGFGQRSIHTERAIRTHLRAAPDTAGRTMDPRTSRFTDRLAMLFENDGQPPIAGRIFGLLLLSDDALSLDELAEALGVSKASASTNARLLAQLGVVEQVRRPGSRRDYYRMVPDLFERSHGAAAGALAAVHRSDRRGAAHPADGERRGAASGWSSTRTPSATWPTRSAARWCSGAGCRRAGSPRTGSAR